jgi:hypothetical protein
MGFIDNKQELFNEIGAAKIVSEYFPELNKTLSNFQSIESKEGNIIELLLDLIRSLTDSGSIKDIFSDLLLDIGKWENDIKVTIKDNIMSVYTKNFDFDVPQGTILEIPVSNLDLNDKLKVDPNTELGGFYYKNNGPTNTDFNRVLQNTVVNNTPNNFLGILDITPNGGDVVSMSVSSTYANSSFDGFVDDFLNSSNLFDVSQLISQIFDTMYGNLSSSMGMGYDWLLDQLKMKETIDKIISKESLSENAVYDDSFFTFDKSTLDNIRRRADMVVNGAYLSDLGCGLASNSINPSKYISQLSDLNNTKPSLVKQKVNNVVSSFISDSTGGVSDNNKNSVEFNLISEIIKNLPTIIFNFFISPQIITIYQMAESLINGTGLNGNTNIPSGIDFRTNSINQSKIDVFLEKMKDVVVCIVKKIYGLLVEYLFEIVKAYVLSLVAAQLAKIVADQAKNYTKILESVNEILATINNIFSLING